MIVTGLLAIEFWELYDEKGSATKLQSPWSLTESQRDICTIIQSECYIFISDKSFNVTHLMNHIKNQISALSDPFPSLEDILENLFGEGSSWLKY